MYKHFMQIYGDYIGNQNVNRKEIQISCPFHKDNKPSMSLNVESGLYHCFSCGKSGSAVNFYMQTRGVSYIQAIKDLGEYNDNYKRPLINLPKPVIVKEEVIVDYSNEVIRATDVFYNVKTWQFFGKKLFELRGITLDTAIACQIGYIKDKGWIFPCIRFIDDKCVGYEIREREFKKFPNGSKCLKADNTPSCMCVVYEGWEKDKCYITEGFIDGYFLYQYLHEKNNGNMVQETILTPSNGVSSIHKLLENQELLDRLSEYKEVIFILDADNAGKKEVEKLMTMNNEWKFFSGLEENEDFAEWYLRIGVKQ